MALLEKLSAYFSAHPITPTPPIWIPKIWNQFGYDAVLNERSGEIQVDPHGLSAAVIEQVLSTPAIELDVELDLDQSTIYAALVRYTAAWSYAGDGQTQSGTFLRMLWLLPLLKKIGVDILYLLPVTKISGLNKKGDIGSPYAVRDYFSLDEALHDPLLDDVDDLTLDNEFAVLIEACHRLGIRVVHDLIPRVTAMDASLINEHPDWIYWIQRDSLEGFAPPEVPELEFFEECTLDTVDSVYRAPMTQDHLAKFSVSPDQLNPAVWAKLKARANGNVTKLVTLIEQELGVVPAPAHSDWINDIQPIWTDITFLRLYFDVFPGVLQYLNEDQPPYILFDTIKCNRFPATQPNDELWDLLDEVVRFQMTEYGLDGFRVDIGHTLPPELLQRLFAQMNGARKHPIIISEDLFNRNHERAAASGYNVMLGSGWNVTANLTWDRLRTHVRELAELKIHVFACGETPDTPRMVSRAGGVDLARMLSIFNGFLPHGVPFINTGLEVNERQPLNCGMGDTPGSATIPRAFFNMLEIDWRSGHDMFELLCRVADQRSRHAALIRPENFFDATTSEPLIAFGYRAEGHGSLAIVMNLSHSADVLINWKTLGVTAGQVLLDSTTKVTNSIPPERLHPLQSLLVWQS